MCALAQEAWVLGASIDLSSSHAFIASLRKAFSFQATVFSTAYRSFSERIANGIAESFMGTLLYGNGVNLWPYIALTTAVVFLIWMVVGYIRETPVS
jgi:hypothetical protein